MTSRRPVHKGCTATATLVLGLWVAACGLAEAQAVYRPGMPGYNAPSYYPVPPRGFRGGRPYECDRYALDQAELYAPPGAGIGAGAVRGAVGGAMFGAIAGGSRGARRGALAGGGLGAVASGARARQQREITYQLAYDDCMLGFRR